MRCCYLVEGMEGLVEDATRLSRLELGCPVLYEAGQKGRVLVNVTVAPRVVVMNGESSANHRKESLVESILTIGKAKQRERKKIKQTKQPYTAR